jgi:hypothetical protein
VGGAGVGGTCVGGGTVVGTGVVVTNTAVGGAEVKVASAAIPTVELGTPDCWVDTVGGGLLAGNLQAVTPIASITSIMQVKNNLLFIVASLDPDAKYQ